jgi:hypothetical protein
VSSVFIPILIGTISGLVVAFKFSWAPTASFWALILGASLLVLAYWQRRRQWMALLLVGVSLAVILSWQMRLEMKAAGAVSGLLAEEEQWQGEVEGRLFTRERCISDVN